MVCTPRVTSSGSSVLAGAASAWRVLEGDRLVDGGLAGDAGEAGREQAAAEPGEQPADQEGAEHVVPPAQWQGKPSRWRPSCTHSCT